MKNKVLKQMLAFSLAVALVGGNSVATFAAEPTNGTESSENTQAATNATTEKKVEKKKTASITFNIDPEMGKFTYPADAEYVAAKGDGYVTVKGDEYSEKQYVVPKVEGINGYTFTGWKLEGATDGNWDADAKTFGITGLAHYAKGSNDGYAALTAQFEAKKADAVLRVHYVDENGTPLDGSQYIVSKTQNGPVGEKATFAATSFTAPEGYELVGDVTDVEVAYGKDKDVNVKVKAKKADAVLRVHYVDENGTPLDGSQYIVSKTQNGPVGEKATFAATSFTAPEGYELVGDVTDVEVAYGKDKDVNVKVKAIKEEKEARDVIVNFNVAPEKGQFKDPAGAKVVTYTIKEDSADQFLVPKVEAKEGYEFTGWLVNGKEEGFWSADTKTFGITGLAHFPEGLNEGYIVVTAQFKEVKEEKAAVVNANVVVDPEKGEFEGYDGATKLENNNLQEADDTLGFLPTVTAKEGYTWTGWEVTNKAGEVVYTLDTNTSSIAFPKGVEDDYTVTATFTENKTTAVVNANVVVDPEKGEFEGYDGATKLENNNLQEADDTLGFLPTVTAKEGYTWTGWEVTNKAGEVVYTLDTNTSSIAFPKGVEDDYTVTATFTENKTTAVVNANVVVDPEKGEFEGYDGATKLENNNLQEADDTLGFLPTVTAKEGYTWTGWEVTNKAGEVVYTLDTNTSSIMFPYGVEDDYTVTATFTKNETPVDPVDPVDPTEPTQPTEPAQPTQPTQPATPSTDNTVNNATNNTNDNKKVEKTAAKKAETKNENKKAPKTGDESMPIAYMLTLVGAAVAAIIVLIKRKRTI